MFRMPALPPSIWIIFCYFFQGFVVAWSGNKNDMAMRLIKYFSHAQEDACRKETELVKELSAGDGHANILKYCWHARSMESIMSCFYYETVLIWITAEYFGFKLYRCFPLTQNSCLDFRKFPVVDETLFFQLSRLYRSGDIFQSLEKVDSPLAAQARNARSYRFSSLILFYFIFMRAFSETWHRRPTNTIT